MDQEPELTFDAESHVYRLRGVVIPNVTRVLEPLSDFSRVPFEALELARQRGTAVHKACELYDMDDLDLERSLDPVLVPYLEAWIRFTADTKCKHLHIEARVWSDAYRYAGTLDRISIIGKRITLLDIKSGQYSPAVELQTAAYQQAAYERGLLNKRQTIVRYAVHLFDDGTYRMHHCKNLFASDLNVFVSALTLYHWRLKHDHGNR